jgi:MGT family glycosyltransferase
MSRVLAYTSPARGHLYPLTPILIELAARGHALALRTLASEIDKSPYREFSARAIDPGIEQITLEDYGAKTQSEALKRAADTFARRAELDAADLQRAIAEESPEILIVDFNCWGAMAAAEAWGGPWATFCPYPTMLRSPDAPPFGPGFAPAHGAFGRLRDRIATPLIYGTVGKSFLPPLNRIREDFGLSPLDRVDDLVLRSPLMLYMSAEPFEYPRGDWPESFVMIGPCTWEPVSNPPDWIDELTRPVILVTTSSEFQDDGQLIEAAFEGLADLPYEVIATAPSVGTEGLKVPANARLEKFVPHGLLLEKATCAVTHGGMGATQKAIAHGVPVCAVPFGRDQLEVARRVEVSGAGTRLPSKRLSPERLRSKVLEAIELREGAARIAGSFEATGGANSAADAVEASLRRSADQSPGR